LEQEVKTKSDWLDKATQELEALAKTNQEEHRKAQEALNHVEAELAEKITWAQSRDTEVTAATAKIDELEARVIERSEWAQRLQRQLEQIYEWKGYKLARKLGLAPLPPE
jgi:predicted RNase H-like nuclease (RuvC/YqgF family)